MTGAHDSKAGMDRLLDFHRRGKWLLPRSTYDRAVALGCDVAGVRVA